MTPSTIEHLEPIIASAPNLRDAGGCTAQDGGQVRTGRFYRSEQLSRISDIILPEYETIIQQTTARGIDQDIFRTIGELILFHRRKQTLIAAS